MTSRTLRPWRHRVAATACAMADMGLVHASSGNVSVRIHDLLLITPSGVPYRWLRPEQVMAMDVERGDVLNGSGVPSSEWRMHAAIYRARQEVKAIVHTHSPWATRCAISGVLRSTSDEARVLLGETVPVSTHAPPGSWELAEAVAAALGVMGKVALVARHGAVSVGRTLNEALLLAEALEQAAGLSEAA